ncbi:MAG TPA: OmpA family protein [Verrucomicrobiae bacterium]|nr:OmpA family protein [Verrucomicrobiae bacterium]
MSFHCNTRDARLLVIGLFAMMAVIFASSSAVAQSDSTPKWDLFAGYQWTHPGATVPVSTGDPNNPSSFKLPDMARGLGGAFTYNFDPHWGLETDAGYSRDTNSSSSEWTLSAGPRFIWRTDTTNFFLHALGGYNRVLYYPGNGLNAEGKNGIGALLGGGMDLPFGKQWGWRVFQVDYLWTRHNYADLVSEGIPNLRRVGFEGIRLRTGVTYSWGGAPAVMPAAACSVQPTEVLVGEPITATVSASNFNPKHTLTYAWSGTGGKVTGKDTTASIDTNDVTPGSYAIKATVTDAKATKNNVASCSATYTVKPLPPKNPPTMTLSANPTSLVTGGNVNLSAECSSPDSVPVSVANWSSTAGSVSGNGNSASLSTTGVPAGSITVTATCTDSRGLNAQASTQVTIENPPPPPVNKELEARLALHSVYFPTNMPPGSDPNAGLLESQQKTLITLATDFKKYLEAKPDAHLTLEGHADMRGSAAFNQALSERRVARVKSFLIEQGVPESDIETKAFGKERNLTLAEVKDSVDKNTELTTEERKRELTRINVILLASNRRVDITLNAAGQTETSVRQFPFNAADALSLIGGRESEMKMKKTAKPAAKRPMKKKQ